MAGKEKSIEDQRKDSGKDASECTFMITDSNQKMIFAFAKYAHALDLATDAQEEERLNIDGIINFILDEGLTKSIKDLVKKHGFFDVEDFISSMFAANDGKEALESIKYKESIARKIYHDKILAQIPLESTQKELQFVEKEQ